MLIIFITSILISLTICLVFLSSNGETVNDRKKDNLSLFNSESKVIGSMEGLEQASKNRLKDEREILFLQDTVGKCDIKIFFNSSWFYESVHYLIYLLLPIKPWILF